MRKSEAYRQQWANHQGDSQADGYAREVAFQRAEQQLTSEGQWLIDAERERLSNAADRVSRSSADIQAAARAILTVLRSRIMDVEEVADQLDELEKQARKNRGGIREIEQAQTANEERAADPSGLMERVYEKYPTLLSPIDLLPGFATDSEKSSPAQRGQPTPDPARALRSRL